MKRMATFSSFLISLVLLTCCNLTDYRLAGAMEEAVARQYKSVSNVHLRQQISWQDGGVVLVTFDAVDNRDKSLTGCYGLGYFRGSFPIYSVFTAMSSCGNTVRAEGPEVKTIALETIPYGYLALVGQETSVAFGLANGPERAQVRVDWNDDESQVVSVVNGSYLSPRSGLSVVKEVALLDEDGNLLATVNP